MKTVAGESKRDTISRLSKSMARKIAFWAPECLEGNIAEYLSTAFERGRVHGIGEAAVLAAAEAHINDMNIPRSIAMKMAELARMETPSGGGESK